MSTDVTMQELEFETAELLPARETLTTCGHRPSGSGFSFTQVVGSGNGNYDGNGNSGLIVIAGNGNGNFNGNALLGGVI